MAISDDLPLRPPLPPVIIGLNHETGHADQPTKFERNRPMHVLVVDDSTHFLGQFLAASKPVVLRDE